MNFTPKSPAELEQEKKERMKLMAPGIADFVVKTANDVIASDKVTEQIELQVEVTDAHGTSKIIKDWLTPKMMEKVRNFCYGTGVPSLYDQGTLVAEHCDGLSGRCMIGVEKGGADSNGGRYPDKNNIRNYIASENAGTSQTQRPTPVAVPDTVAAMRKAQQAFKEKSPSSTPRDELVEGWKQRVHKYFFGKNEGLITAAEWAKFAADGFEKVKPAEPFGEPAFSGTDDPNDPSFIPF